ncbi:hypothetical protein ACF9IK_28980 [Kitasatospora hibisci]|uniref:hypothetical protein n=1 Tax=Kitasatospora hibisci TaxID=3369522 RepID=UPI0037544428
MFPTPSGDFAVGSPGHTESPRIVAAATLAFPDAVLRDEPGDPAGVLPAYGDLSVHHPDRNRRSAGE